MKRFSWGIVAGPDGAGDIAAGDGGIRVVSDE